MVHPGKQIPCKMILMRNQSRSNQSIVFDACVGFSILRECRNLNCSGNIDKRGNFAYFSVKYIPTPTLKGCIVSTTVVKAFNQCDFTQPFNFHNAIKRTFATIQRKWHELVNAGSWFFRLRGGGDWSSVVVCALLKLLSTLLVSPGPASV